VKKPVSKLKEQLEKSCKEEMKKISGQGKVTVTVITSEKKHVKNKYESDLFFFEK